MTWYEDWEAAPSKWGRGGSGVRVGRKQVGGRNHYARMGEASDRLPVVQRINRKITHSRVIQQAAGLRLVETEGLRSFLLLLETRMKGCCSLR